MVKHAPRRLFAALGLTVGLLGSGIYATTAPLQNLADEQVVQRIRYCRGEYRLTVASGARHQFPERNLRFKTDGSREGPEPGRPALLPAGMRGDRAQVIFSGLEELKRFLVEECDGTP
jgi:cytochrome c